jgi:hypothetical protein
VAAQQIGEKMADVYLIGIATDVLSVCRRADEGGHYLLVRRSGQELIDIGGQLGGGRAAPEVLLEVGLHHARQRLRAVHHGRGNVSARGAVLQSLREVLQRGRVDDAVQDAFIESSQKAGVRPSALVLEVLLRAEELRLQGEGGSSGGEIPEPIADRTWIGRSI